jgi:hypothetical protein
MPARLGEAFAQPVPFRPPMPRPRREVRPRRPRGPGPWYWSRGRWRWKRPPLGLGVRALAAVSERGSSAGSACGVPRLMLVSLILGELPIWDAMVGVAVLD